MSSNSNCGGLPILPVDIVDYLSKKGQEAGGGRGGKRNALVMRRIMQIIEDVSLKPFNELRVLDLACGEGAYAIECALHGAEVNAVDGRTERMQHGIEFGRRLQLQRLKFEQRDVRSVTRESHGGYDVVLFLGILYHLDVPDSISVIENLYKMSDRMLIVDTHVALDPDQSYEYMGRVYSGCRTEEHKESDSPEARKRRFLMSLDNTYSYWFARESLTRMLYDVGFTSVYECHVPMDPFKRGDRITLVACRGNPVGVATYPWINNLSESEIYEILREEASTLDSFELKHSKSRKHALRIIANRLLRPFGVELRRI